MNFSSHLQIQIGIKPILMELFHTRGGTSQLVYFDSSRNVSSLWNTKLLLFGLLLMEGSVDANSPYSFIWQLALAVVVWLTAYEWLQVHTKSWWRGIFFTFFILYPLLETFFALCSGPSWALTSENDWIPTHALVSWAESIPPKERGLEWSCNTLHLSQNYVTCFIIKYSVMNSCSCCGFIIM